MARKNLLTGLTAVKPEAAETGEDAAPPARRGGGAIGVVGRSFAQMRANSVIEVPADLIDAAGIEDRLGEDPEQAALIESLREYGQQVPVLLRHSPNHEGRYDVVYGRRRVAAMRALGGKVRAMVRDLPDRELIVAQGQENTARKNLSFIEQANFARQMRDQGFDRKVIGDALSQGEAVLSKMLTVTDRVPFSVIHAIGAAPRTGRDRWLAFARALEGHEERALDAARAAEGDSDARFEAALAAIAPSRTSGAAPPKGATAAPWGGVRRGVRGTTISIDRDHAAFADWLLGRMDALHADWRAQSAATDPNETKE